MPSRVTPTRTLPERPSLAQLRKQAKELLRSFRARDAACVVEVERFERCLDAATFALSDAQRVLARAYGFSSWRALKQHVEGTNVAALCIAAERGDIASVRRIAKARPDLINAQRGGEFGERTALHYAVLRRDAEMCRALLELGANARAGIWPHRDATTAHAIAEDRGYDEIVAVIEQQEARRRAEWSPSGATIDARALEAQQAILDGRDGDAMRIIEADPSLVAVRNVQGATPLHFAAWKHSPAMIAWLLARGAPVDAEDAERQTPLDYAAIVAGWSAHGRHFSGLNNGHVSPAQFEETLRLLRSNGAELTIRGAVAAGDMNAVLQFHADGRLTNKIHKLRGGLVSIAVRVNRPEMVSLLLELGLDPDESLPAEQSWGMPLWFAAMCGRHEIAELLLTRGADVNAVVFACGDALCIAQGTRDDRMKALLLEHGARLTVERVAAEGDRKAARAILNGTLTAHSLNADQPTLDELAEQMLWAAGPNDSEIVRMCLPYVTRRPDDPWWNYVLLHATLLESFQLVLDHGVSPDVRGDGGYTILHHLATSYCDQRLRIPRAKALLDAGASLEVRDPLLQSTPLGWACRWGRRDLTQLYLEWGAPPVEPAAEPWATPLAWAIKRGHVEIAELLRAREAAS